MKKFIFQLAISLMNRLTYSRKMMVVAAVFIVPLIILTYQVVAGFEADITFAEQELKGNEYLRPTLALMQHVQQHRGASAGFLGGDATFKDIMAQKQTAITADIAAIDAMEQSMERSSRRVKNGQLSKRRGRICKATSRVSQHPRALPGIPL
ncbi:MAG: hypothetical protein HC875_35865 [Anaerolineales bacterium]|nr:hypothetical protein [Anaerolineales bacterium]